MIRSGAARACIAFIMAGGCLPPLEAAEVDASQTGDNAMPDLEFLEFLGQFETDEGQWISPGNLMSEEIDDLLEVAESIEAPIIETPIENDSTNDDQ
jgi:hypothetical protein